MWWWCTTRTSATYENLRRKELRIGRLILIPWYPIGQDPICVGAHHMLKIQLGCVKWDRWIRIIVCPVSDRTQTHIKSTPRKEFRLNWLEPNHWSRSSYTSTVLVDDPTSLLFVADVVDGVTLSSLGQGGSAAQQSNGPSASEAGTARTVTLWNGINFTGRIFGMSVNWSPFNQCTVLCKIEIGFKRYGIFIILNINVNLKTWTKRKGLELGHKRTRVFILPPNANHNAGQPAQGKFQ